MSDAKRDLTLHLLDILGEADGPNSDGNMDSYDFDIEEYPSVWMEGYLDLQHLAAEMLRYFGEPDR